MKKTLLIAGMIAAPISMAAAKGITFNTPIKWNAEVITQALKDTGIIPNTYSDVEYVHNRILRALLTLDTFSARDAVGVCMDECNKSDMLKYGRGKSGKRCPQLCEEFASSLVIANNDVLTGNTERQKVGSDSVHVGRGYFSSLTDLYADVVTTFKDEEHSPKEFCKILTEDAFKRGVKYPMVCGGKCHLLGQDIIEVYNNKTVRYEVGDFCDGFFNNAGEYYFEVHYDGTIDKIK